MWRFREKILAQKTMGAFVKIVPLEKHYRPQDRFSIFGGCSNQATSSRRTLTTPRKSPPTPDNRWKTNRIDKYLLIFRYNGVQHVRTALHDSAAGLSSGPSGINNIESMCGQQGRLVRVVLHEYGSYCAYLSSLFGSEARVREPLVLPRAICDSISARGSLDAWSPPRPELSLFLTDSDQRPC